MSRICILSDALASQVAAGEVVERPAAVVRELMENSLDAGATQIEVHVQRGGSSLIRISDNGHGMNREDAMMCLERHATSKIRTKEDLNAIRTFGFRGEALPSIASVSRFRLATREPQALTGTEIEVLGGRLTDVREYGGNAGTVIEARSLFYNIPARRKFLRSEATEFAHVEQQFRLHAIAHPQVTFTLIRDGQIAYHLPAATDLLERIEGLCGTELAQRLLPLKETRNDELFIKGYIGGAAVSRANRNLQITFLNGRPIESGTITYALREGYHNSIMKGQFPVTFLFLEMDPQRFDINVHPAKKEVRFHNNIAIREGIVKAVSETLSAPTVISSGLAFGTRQLPTIVAQQSSLNPPISTPVVPTEPALAPAYLPPLEPKQYARFEPTLPSKTTHSPPPEEVTQNSATETAKPSTELQKPNFRILGVLHKLYVLMESQDGLVLMDQHAAHERILYEQLRRAMEKNGVPTQRLLLPQVWELSPRDHDLIRQNLLALQRLGIELSDFGHNSFKIDALPSFIKAEDPLVLLSTILDELMGLSSRSSSLRLGEDVIITSACRAAVKANDHLKENELLKLLDDLYECEMPFCCPHGRPTLIQITLAELEKKFGRRAP